jgi:hypothetical protein
VRSPRLCSERAHPLPSLRREALTRSCATRKSFFLDGVFDAAMTYLLFWTCEPRA